MPALALPDPDTTQLSRSPLELVVCQIRHERRLIAGEGATALAIHEALGGAEGAYPKLDPVADTLDPGSRGWRCTSSDGAWIVTVMPDNFSLETTAYTTWKDDFEPRLEAVIDAVTEHVQPTVEQRIGLRYVDRVDQLGLSDLTEWRPYLRSEILGIALHPQLGPGVRNYQQRILLELDEGIASGITHGPVLTDDTVDYQLDYDVFRQGGRAFDPARVKSDAARFNIFAVQLFHATVTDELLEALR